MNKKKKEAPGYKTTVWEGDSLKQLNTFPEDVKDTFGFNIDRLQQGKKSPIAKHWEGSVWELKDDGSDGKTYRVAYVAIIDDEVTVLHCFDKTTPRTSPGDSKKIKSRLAEVMKRKAIRKKIKKKGKTK